MPTGEVRTSGLNATLPGRCLWSDGVGRLVNEAKEVILTLRIGKKSGKVSRYTKKQRRMKWAN